MFSSPVDVFHDLERRHNGSIESNKYLNHIQITIVFYNDKQRQKPQWFHQNLILTRLRDLETLWKSNDKAAASRVSIDFLLVTAFKFSACELDFIKKTKRWKWWISDEIKKIVYFPHAKRTLYLLLDNFSNFSLIHLTMKICHTRFFIDTALILSCLKNYLLTLWSILCYYLIQNIIIQQVLYYSLVPK